MRLRPGQVVECILDSDDESSDFTDFMVVVKEDPYQGCSPCKGFACETPVMKVQAGLENIGTSKHDKTCLFIFWRGSSIATMNRS